MDYRLRLRDGYFQRPVVIPENAEELAFRTLLLVQVHVSNGGGSRPPLLANPCHHPLEPVPQSMHCHMRLGSRPQAGGLGDDRLARWIAYAQWRHGTC